MTRIRLMFNMLAVFVACVLLSSIGQAQATRTWVSGAGDDANPCSRTAPCQTFAAAFSKTQTWGEISALDAGPYGAVTINRAMTINGDGTLASILVNVGNGIIVSAGANETVVIRGISIIGMNGALNGIKYVSGKHLHIENCSIYGFSSASSFGIQGATTTTSEMTVVNTAITNCHVGIRVSGSGSGTLTAAISDVKIQHGDFGVDVLGTGTATVKNSFISHQTADGLVAESGGVLNVASCAVTDNLKGIITFGIQSNSIIRISNCDIYGNGTGVDLSVGGIGFTFGNNRMTRNGTDIAGSVLLQMIGVQ